MFKAIFKGQEGLYKNNIIMANRRKKQLKTETVSSTSNVEVYDHVKDEIKFIKSNEITIAEQIFSWLVVALVFIFLTYIIL
jgi:hypothetical protein